jgi:Biotin-lipoyl like
MTITHSPPNAWPVLAGLQQRCLQAADSTALLFLLANETFHLAHYTQACVLLPDALQRPRLQVVSGLSDASEDTPFTLWVRRVAAALAQAGPATDARRLQAQQLDEDLHAGWAEWWPQHALHLPLVTPRGAVLGSLLLVRDAAWSDDEVSMLQLLAGTAAHALQALGPPTSALGRQWRRLRHSPRRLALTAAVVLGALCIPVRVSVVAPAEIIALKSEAVAAPAEGIVKAFHVAPNQAVKRGDALFSLDDTTLRNRREIAARALQVARADVLATQQKAFDSTQSRADLAALQGRAQEREAEVAWLDESLKRIEVRAEHDGVFVYGDANDWTGKPVVTGERIALLAQPHELGVMVWLPVGDAITLQAGAPMRVYLQTAPLSALQGELVQTSYQATLSPEGVASYRVRGQLGAGQSAHIGLRGVAKVYGDWQPLVYWLMRRPLGALRQTVGL